MKTILVTGSLGTIGQKLVRELKLRGHCVFGCDLIHNPNEVGFRVSDRIQDASYFRCDVGEFRQIDRVIQKLPQLDLVYHAAAEFGRWNGEDFYEQLWRTNAVGTKNIIKLQEEYKFRIVHFSSSEVYGDWSSDMSESVMSERPIRQMNDYAISKWVNEMQLQNAKDETGCEWVILRLFNTYGPGEMYSPYRSANCRMLHCALNGIPWKVHSGHIRTSSYVDDSVRTIANIADKFIPGSIYNISGDKPHTMEELSDIIIRVTGCSKTLVSVMPPEPMTTHSKRPTNSKAVEELGHKCEVSLEDGIRRTADWMRTL